MTDVSAVMPTTALGGPGLQAGYGVSLTDLSSFESALANAGGALEAQPEQAPSEAMQALFKPLEHLNAESASLSDYAKSAMTAGADLTPGQMVMLTVKSHEFLFHSQLTANVANRTSDGLQQLFRQQA